MVICPGNERVQPPLEGQHLVARAHHEAGEDPWRRRGEEVGPRPAAAGVQRQVLRQVAIRAGLGGMVEIEAVGEGVAVEQGVVAGPIEHRQHVTQHRGIELRPIEGAMIGGVFHQGPARGDQRGPDPQRFHEVQRMTVAAARGQDDADPRRDGLPQGRASGRRQRVAAVDQRAINVDGEEAVARGHGRETRERQR